MSHLSEAILHDTKGIVLTLQDASIASMLREYADFFVIDAAARPFSNQVIQEIVYAAQDTPVLVRTADNLPSTLQAYLNCGVDGLILTGINHAIEAEKAIAACLYPPEGIRQYRASVATQQFSLQALNDQITFIVEITTPQAITQIDEICEVTGINGILVSPTRMAVSMERNFDTDSDDVQAGLRQLHTASRGYELPFGLEGEGFDCTADFSLNWCDAELLMQGLERVAGTRSQGSATGKITIDQEDDEFGLQLVARR